MNMKFRCVSRRVLGLVAVAMLLLSAGCLEKRIVWSPDGSRAAVISEDGLYLCDATGHLSGLLAPRVYLAAWRSDSQRLVLARKLPAKDWNLIAPTLGDRRAAIEAEADSLWRDLEAGKPWSVLSLNLSGKKDVVQICLRDRHRDALPDKLSAGERQALDEKAVELNELVLARVDGEKLAIEGVRYTGYGSIADIRPAPRDDAVAVAEEMATNTDDMEIAVVSLKTDAAPVVVGRRTAPYPDWTADGRSLVYVEVSPGAAPKNDLVLGVLMQRGVLDADGRVSVAEKPEYLAGTMFNLFTHVRCLRDGRVLFNAVEMSLPLAAADYGGDQREQLFAVDPSRQSTLVRLIPRRHETELPQALAFFEVSPDERDVVFGGMEGEVGVLTIATGEVRKVQDGAKEKYQGLPVWRRAGEFSYVKRMESMDGKPPARPAEVILRNGDKETVLSQSWPSETLARIATNHSK
jgi:hypothetical protein